MYSARTSSILVCMIITGVGRSIAVKLFYQLGYDNALFVSLLYLLGQSLSVFVHLITNYCGGRGHNKKQRVEFELASCIGDDDDTGFVKPICRPTPTALQEGIDTGTEDTHMNRTVVEGEVIENGERTNCVPNGDSSYQLSKIKMKGQCDEVDDEEAVCNILTLESDRVNLVLESKVTATTTPEDRLIRRGSSHGLTEESIEAISFVHRIPWYVKPAISGFFNLCNSGLRWASYIYVPASKAEMLIAGSELIFSVLASRFIRRRLVSGTRWIAVGIVSIGLLFIGFSHLPGDGDAETNIDYAGNQDDVYDDMPSTSPRSSTSSHHTTGNILILGQSLMSVLQDIADEIFLQEADFPATLLLGMEGCYGLLIALVIYIITVPFLKQDSTSNLFMDGRQLTTFMVIYSAGLTLWFTLTGIFNVCATEATSSMTRNVWKNARTLLVWLIGLIIYYCYNEDGQNNIGNNDDNESSVSIIGEGWTSPESYIILFGYAIMVVGLYVYYQ